MKKFIYIPTVIFILSLTLTNCSNEYDGGIYTGSSMSAKQPVEKIDEELKITQNQQAEVEVVIENVVEETTSEENYK
jgi:hypothetical protein